MNLEFWTNKLGSRNKALFRLRNSAIKKTVREYDASQPVSLYYQRVIHDVATSSNRANHYGVKVGGVIKSYRNKREDYISRYAEITARIRSIAIEEGISNL